VKGLFEELSRHKPEGEAWPKSPKGFADALRRVAPGLRTIGVNARISDKAGKHGFGVVLKWMPAAPDSSSARENSRGDVHHVHHVHPAAPAGDGELGGLGEHASDSFCAEDSNRSADAETF
jgi:hypothetical protein